MKVIDFKLTNSREGTLTAAERIAAIVAADDALNYLGLPIEEAESAACRAAFHGWARWPDSAELIVEV